MDWDFAAEEDFGLAKSFTNAPLGIISPSLDDEIRQNEYSTDQLAKDAINLDGEQNMRVDGFNFKMAPSNDVSKTRLNQETSA